MNVLSPSVGNVFATFAIIEGLNLMKVNPRKIRLGDTAPVFNSHDAGHVRLGGSAPVLATHDAGRVRLGGSAPVLATHDAGKVRP